jgi:hypothetical protein
MLTSSLTWPPNHHHHRARKRKKVVEEMSDDEDHGDFDPQQLREHEEFTKVLCGASERGAGCRW